MDKKERLNYLINKIPFGKICSYSDLAIYLETTPRIVGFLLNSFSKEEMLKAPWYRVVNKKGFISSAKLGEKGKLQQLLLEKEGIEIKDYQIINPKEYWYKFNI